MHGAAISTLVFCKKKFRCRNSFFKSYFYRTKKCSSKINVSDASSYKYSFWEMRIACVSMHALLYISQLFYTSKIWIFTDLPSGQMVQFQSETKK